MSKTCKEGLGLGGGATAGSYNLDLGPALSGSEAEKVASTGFIKANIQGANVTFTAVLPKDINGVVIGQNNLSGNTGTVLSGKNKDQTTTITALTGGENGFEVNFGSKNWKFIQVAGTNGNPGWVDVKDGDGQTSGGYQRYQDIPGGGQATSRGRLLSNGTFAVSERTEKTEITTTAGQALKVETTREFTALGENTATAVTTTTREFTSTTGTSPWDGRIQSVDRPDLVREVYAYEAGTFTTGTDPSTRAFAAGTGETATWVKTTTRRGLAGTDPTSLTDVAWRSTQTTTITDGEDREWCEIFSVYNPGTNAYAPVSATHHTYDSQGRRTLTSLVTYNSFGSAVDVRTTQSTDWTDPDAPVETDEFGTQTVTVETSGGYGSGSSSSVRTKRGVSAWSGYPEQKEIVTQQLVTTLVNGTRVESELTEPSANALIGYSGPVPQRLTSRSYADSKLTDSTEQGLTTLYTYQTPGSNQQTTTTQPSGATEIRIDTAAGELISVTGTGTASSYYSRGTNTDATTWDRVDYGAPTSLNYSKTTRDFLGRTILEERPAFGGGLNVREYFYNAKGQIYKETATGQAARLSVYDTLGELQQSGYDVDGNGQLELNGNGAVDDVVEQTATTYALENNLWYRVTTRSTARSHNSTALSTTFTTKERLTLAPNMVSETISIDAAGAQTKRTVEVNRNNALVTETTTTTGITNPEIRITRNGLLQSVKLPHQTNPTTYTYDLLGRVQTVTDPSVATATNYYYTVNDQLQSMSSGFLTTFMVYHPAGVAGAGQVSSRTEAGLTTNYTYTLHGQVAHTWGASYPVSYEYDAFDRLRYLRTYRTAPPNLTAATWTGGDLTTWNYDTATGSLLNKVDAQGRQVTYAYWPSGALKTRTWARNVVTNYAYTTLGQLQSVTYSDSTPAVTLTYTRDGRPDTQIDGAGTRTYAYDSGWRSSGETYTAGELVGLAIANPVDTIGRSSSLTVSNNAAAIHSVAYAYDLANGRLDRVSSGGYSAAYGYAPQSTRLGSVTHSSGPMAKLASTRTYDSLGRLDTIYTRLPAASTAVTGYDYNYDANNRRDYADLADGTHWDYGYNDHSEVTSGRHRQTTGGADIPGRNFGYTYDAIGNRTQTNINAHPATYTPNSLNQYTQRQIPPFVEVSGEMTPGARVVVSDFRATESGKYYYAAVPVRWTETQANYVEINVVAAKAQPTGPDAFARLATGHLFLPQNPEGFGYDPDGNLLSDGRWSYTWDAENRLKLMGQRMDTGAGVTQRQIQFTYDAQGRRVRKHVLDMVFTGGYWHWTVTSSRRFLYDGWNLVAEVDATASNATLSTHVWGLDVSGSTQAAGGVGGLLWTNSGSTAPQAPAYDGNGNIMAWVDLDTQTTSGENVYGPFGERVRATGVAATLPFGFSTKYTDRETSFAYYGLRYYNPNTGRWLSRDPIGEEGGLNLCGMVGNNPLNKIDYLGQCSCEVTKFKIDVKGWTRGWPNFRIWGTKTYTLYLNVEFEIEVKDESKCKIQQWKKGETGGVGAKRDIYKDWAYDGSTIWNSAAWSGIPHSNWSGGKGRRKASFEDKPGFHTILDRSFPVYWGGVGGSGPFQFKTQVLNASDNTVVRELIWGMWINYASPSSGSHHFYL